MRKGSSSQGVTEMEQQEEETKDRERERRSMIYCRFLFNV